VQPSEDNKNIFGNNNTPYSVIQNANLKSDIDPISMLYDDNIIPTSSIGNQSLNDVTFILESDISFTN
jgi:hypothetical protein